MQKVRISVVAVVAVLMLVVGTAAEGRMISGELVVTKGSAHQFRIVDHGGFFNAPAGTSIEDLDGKAVEVELGPDNRVLGITEKRIETNPRLRSYEIVSGQLIIANNATGAFSITGDGSYVAPVGFDLRPYANQMVDLFVDESGHVKSIDRSGTSALPTEDLGAPAAVTGIRSCLVGDATVGTGSTICRSGVMYRCNDGNWSDARSACR